uniref:Neuromedin U n=1 Tax=Chrysemys picta bellii TaxID=8478 RepID=A0A8C3IQP4_CHRPI
MFLLKGCAYSTRAGFRHQLTKHMLGAAPCKGWPILGWQGVLGFFFFGLAGQHLRCFLLLFLFRPGDVTSQFLQIDDACSAYLSIIDPHPETSSALEELCFMVMGFLQKPQVSLEERDNTKRFLFHYSKTHDSGNSNIMSSVLHPLLQLVPQLHERRLKRYKADRQYISSRGSFKNAFDKLVPG